MPNRKKRWQRYRTELSFLPRLVMSFTITRLYEIRNDFATRYITGVGYEIGAQKAPLSCKNSQRVIYIDYLSRTVSAQKYHIPETECVKVDIIADANNLTHLPTESASFIIANHVLEHSPDPISTLLGWLRILQTNGRLFLTLPNYKSNEFDFEKKPTAIAHLIKDYEGAQNNDDISSAHIFEHITMIDGIAKTDTKQFERRYNEIVKSELHTHYHVFNKDNVLNLLHFIHQLVPIKLKNSLTFDNSFELLFIIEKIAPELHTPIKIKQDRVLNILILVKNFVIFLYNRTFKKKIPN